MVAAGALHPLATPSPEIRASVRAGTLCSVVIPTRGDDPERLEQLVDSVRAEFEGAVPIVVVDDAGPRPLRLEGEVTVLRTPSSLGPGGARMAGLAATDTPWVVFLDDDVETVPGWTTALLGHLEDPRLGLIAPRIRGPVPGRSASRRERFERDRSPLDLGPWPAPIRPGTPVAYVPAAAILVRREAIEAVGGFDADLRVGEDVDLVWRLHDAGWTLRYEPASVLHHRARATAAAWWAQRRGYGTSAAALARRHGRRVAPVRTGPLIAGGWLAAAGGRPRLAILAFLTAIAWTIRTLRARRIPRGWRFAVRWSTEGILGTGAQVARATLRAWWPLAAIGSLRSRRIRRLVTMAILVSSGRDAFGVRDADATNALERAVGARLDDLAYGWGVWQGLGRHRHLGAILPAITPLQSEAS